jgi:hypothetical protein
LIAPPRAFASSPFMAKDLTAMIGVFANVGSGLICLVAS